MRHGSCYDLRVVDDRRIDDVLAACERSLAGAEKVDLRALGFWRAVEAVKRDRALVERYADRIARIDRGAFLRSVPLVFPAPVGVVLLTLGTVAGVVLVVAALALPALWRDLALLAGAGALIGATHGLAHYVVGGLFGMRFTHWFSLPPKKPQPGFKIDYATYLRVSATSRAWMHASGAIVSKLVPFVVLVLALVAGAEPWTLWILLAIGLVQLVTDALFSVRASDWKKFRREMRAARASR